MPDEDAEVSSYFSEAPPSDVYDVSYACDPYAAFDPDVSATSEDDNHEPSESGSAQRSFKKIGEQWGAMVTSHSTDRDRSHSDSRSQYSEQKRIRKDMSNRHDRRKNRNKLRQPAATRSPSGQSPAPSIQDQGVDIPHQGMHLVSEEVQAVVEDAKLSSQDVEENCLTSHDGILHSTANTLTVDMVDQEVQCSPKTADSLKKEYIRLALFCDYISWFNCLTVDVQLVYVVNRV